jgi:hypothetical protein
MSNPYIERRVPCYEDAQAFNRLGSTLRKLGIVDVLYMEVDEVEELAAGCGCGGCYTTYVSAGVIVSVGDKMGEWTVCDEWY